jgi:hypothetical protein
MLNEHRTARLYIDVRFYYSSAPVHTIIAPHTENSMSSAIAASVEVGVFPPGWATYSAAREFGIGQSLRQPLNEKCAANCRFIPMIHERAVTASHASTETSYSGRSRATKGHGSAGD